MVNEAGEGLFAFASELAGEFRVFQQADSFLRE